MLHFETNYPGITFLRDGHYFFGFAPRDSVLSQVNMGARDVSNRLKLVNKIPNIGPVIV